MPTYEYRCVKGHVFDVFQKMSDEPVAVCPECGEAASRLVSGGAGFLFKGEGFYITDYRSPDYKKKAEADRMRSPGSGGEKPARVSDSTSGKAEPSAPAASSGEGDKGGGDKGASRSKRSGKGSSGSGGSSTSGTDG
jgi:putative FmdB family regulatory protein